MNFSCVFICILVNITLCCNAHISDLGHTTRTENSDPLLESINGTCNYRMIGKKGKEDKTWFDGREMNYIYCVRPAKCETYKNATCLGSNLPYNSISFGLTDAYNQRETLDKLNAFQALRHIPKCWAVIQPFLCALYTPKCEKINNQEMVYLPSLSMCKIAMEACRLLNNTNFFPEFFRCDEKLYPPNCQNDVREMKFNVTGQCLKPLVQAESYNNFYKDVEGCGVQCKDPLYTDDEHRQIHKLIGWGASICLGFNVFTILTFFIDWQNASKYPALTIFYVNFCFMISCLGWLAQFTPGGRDDIICRRDGTLRHSEPSAGENLSCIVVFVLVYYFLIAAMVWFVIFTYAWCNMSYKSIGKIQGRIDKRGSYFHLVAWSLPLVLTITIMALSEVDGSSVVGICFVGYLNHGVRASLLLGPVLGVLLVGGYFLGRGMLALIQLNRTSKEFISQRAANKIRETIVRMGLCAILTLVFMLATIVCHINEFKNFDDWADSLRQHIICKISNVYSDSNNKCKMESRPSVAILQLHLLCFFASGIVMSSWVWTHSTVDAWKRYVRKKFGHEIDEPIKFQKHKLIAQAFAKRKEFQNQGRLSINFHNSHTDPVGLNFDLNSSASNDFSSTWANNLPRFVNRRYALTGATTSSSHGPRRNSVDSEISFSVRHVSVESRRNSIDSQVSVKIAEVKTKVASRSRGSKGRHSRHHRKRDFPTGKKFTRRESSTSMESQIITALQKAKYSDKGGGVGGGSLFTPYDKNMKRRTANAGLDPSQINALLSNGKLIFPFLQNQGMTTSDEEDESLASFKVQDSRIDVIMKKVALDDSDSEESSPENNKPACEIHEYNTTDDEKVIIRNHNNKNGYPSIHNAIEGPKRNNDDGLLSVKTSKDGGRVSKNSSKSVRSRKSSRTSNRRNQKSIRNSVRGDVAKSYKPQTVDKKDKEKDVSDFDDSSFTSFCSELSPLGGVQSSYSGISLEKTNSRSSKRSCDVGIQANAHEIATQTMSTYETGGRDYPIIEKSHKDDENLNIYAAENQTLLPQKGKKEQGTTTHMVVQDNRRKVAPTTKKRNGADDALTETEKLKLLLLPSK